MDSELWGGGEIHVIRPRGDKRVSTCTYDEEIIQTGRFGMYSTYMYVVCRYVEQIHVKTTLVHGMSAKHDSDCSVPMGDNTDGKFLRSLSRGGTEHI